MSTLLKQTLFMLIFIHGSSSTKLLTVFDRIEVCDKPSHPQFKWENFTFAFENGSSIVHSDAEYTGNNPITDVQIRVNCKRCAIREAPDTCQDYQTLVVSNGCTFITLDGLMWTPFLEAINPPFKCPVKKGKFRQTKGYFDAKMFLMFPIEEWYWKLKITINVKRKHLITLCMEGQVKRKIV